MTTSSPVSKPAWVQLYEARRMTVEIEARSPGRPPGPVPRHKVGITLSQGEIHELEGWQERLTALLQRKVSMGETVGILTRICTARLLRLSESPDLRTLADLAEDMIGHE